MLYLSNIYISVFNYSCCALFKGVQKSWNFNQGYGMMSLTVISIDVMMSLLGWRRGVDKTWGMPNGLGHGVRHGLPYGLPYGLPVVRFSKTKTKHE